MLVGSEFKNLCLTFMIITKAEVTRKFSEIFELHFGLKSVMQKENLLYFFRVYVKIP